MLGLPPSGPRKLCDEIGPVGCIRLYRTTRKLVAYDTAVAVSQVASEASGQRPQRDDRLGFLVGGSLSGQIIHYCSNTGVISSPRDVEEVGRDTR